MDVCEKTKKNSILERLNHKSAEDILDMCGLTDEIPVDISKIMRFFGISVYPASFTDIEKMPEMVSVVKSKGEILGAAFIDNENVGIFYRESDSLNRQRFTIAHELGHCCLSNIDPVEGHIQFRLEKDTAPDEIAANTFAGALLVPEKQLSRIVQLLPSVDIPFLSDIFKVSEQVMTERLKVLKISLS